MGDEMMGFRLKKARERVGLTQDAVCQEIGLANNQSLSSYERGTNCPTVDTVKKLCKVYGVSADYLLFGDDQISAQEKTPIQYAKQFVDAVDHLGMTVEEVVTELGKECMAVCIPCGPSEFNTFAYHWSRLREILDSQIIEREEYIMLISRRLEELKMLTPSQNCMIFGDKEPGSTEKEQ